MRKDWREITDVDGEVYHYDNNAPITLQNPWTGAPRYLSKGDALNLDGWATLMDDDLRDHLHGILAPCPDWDFVKAWSELVTVEEASRVIIGS